MPDPETRIATQLFSGTLYETKERTPEQLSQAIEFALDVADEILRRRRRRDLPKLENSPPTSEPAPSPTATKERLIEREAIAPLDTLLAQRRNRGAQPSEKSDRKGPTLH